MEKIVFPETTWSALPLSRRKDVTAILYQARADTVELAKKLGAMNEHGVLEGVDDLHDHHEDICAAIQVLLMAEHPGKPI